MEVIAGIGYLIIFIIATFSKYCSRGTNRTRVNWELSFTFWLFLRGSKVPLNQ